MNKNLKVCSKESVWGVNREREAPVPIPNTEVKPLIGDDTWRETSWESSTMPHLKFAQAAIK